MEESLKDMLKHGRKFERLRIDESGIFIRKLPPTQIEKGYLAVEINPIGQNGLPMYKIGALVKNQSELSAVRSLLSQKKVDELLHLIEKVNSQQSEDER